MLLVGEDHLGANTNGPCELVEFCAILCKMHNSPSSSL